jgi:general secretion pathway protein L
MDAWLSTLATDAVTADAIIPDNHGLARIPGTISVFLTGDHLFINDGGDVELVMENVGPLDALTAMGAVNPVAEGADDEHSTINSMPRHLLVYCAAETEQKYEADWIALREELDSVDVKILPDGIMPKLAATVATGAGINLLQGKYSPKTEYAALFRPWRPAAILLIGFLLVGVGGNALDLYMLSNQEEQLRISFNTEYRSMLPGAPEINDPIAVVESLRRRTGIVGTPPIFLQSMEQVSKAVQENSGARILAISFRAGVIDLRVSAPDVTTLDNLQRIIGENGQFRATIQSTDQDGQQVSSRIQIQEVAT